jgi:hypothetical protein
MYLFTHAGSIANAAAGRWEQALELGKQSLRLNRLHTPTLRTFAAAQGRVGDMAGARQTMAMIRELDPTLTATSYLRRYPGRDSPHAEGFAQALVSAGLPA